MKVSTLSFAATEFLADQEELHPANASHWSLETPAAPLSTENHKAQYSR